MKTRQLKSRPLPFVLILVLMAHATCAQITLVNVGNTNNGGLAHGIAVAGNYAYIANDTDGLRIYDVSNPAHPVNVGHTNNGGTAYNVAVSGHFAYVAAYTNGLLVYYILTPANPVNVGHTNFSGFVFSLAVQGDYAYLGGDSSFGIFNIINPGTPTLVVQTNGGIFPGANPAGVAVSGNYVVLADGGGSPGGVTAFSLSNGTNLTNLGRTNNGGSANGVALAGQYAYVANGTDGFRIYDLSLSGGPVSVGHVTNAPISGASGNGVTLSGNFAFLADAAGGLRVFDITSAANPIIAGQVFGFPLFPYDVAVSGNYAYVANGQDGLSIYAIEPQLNIGLADPNTLLISWPAIGSFGLQQNMDLATSNWMTLTNKPVTSGSQNQILLPLSGDSVFYRLKSP